MFGDFKKAAKILETYHEHLINAEKYYADRNLPDLSSAFHMQAKAVEGCQHLLLTAWDMEESAFAASEEARLSSLMDSK